MEGTTLPRTPGRDFAVPADAVRPKPKNLSFDEAAAVGVNFVAAWLGLVDTAHVKSGEWVLATGAVLANEVLGLELRRLPRRRVKIAGLEFQGSWLGHGIKS
jgi:hypothetical protein